MITKTFPPYDLPDDCKFFEDYVKVQGIKYNENEVFRFIPNPQHQMSLQLELEPYNKVDKNAIKVIGIVKKLFGSKRYFIGYVPAEISAHIYKKGWQNEVKAILTKISYDEDYSELRYPSINIIFAIYVPL